MPGSRGYRTRWQRDKRARLAIAAGREPHRIGRPSTGRKPRQHGDRTAEYRRRSELRRRANGDAGSLLDHPLLWLARAFAWRVVRPDRGAVQYQPLYEDATGAAVLAICEGSDPEAAARRFVRWERSWWARTTSLP